jgi:hypothetical protein
MNINLVLLSVPWNRYSGRTKTSSIKCEQNSSLVRELRLDTIKIFLCLTVFESRKTYGCLTMDWTVGVRSLTEAEDFSFNVCFQTGCGAHPASYTMGTGGKGRPGRDADHSPPSSAEVKKE